jgi:hypothetical protein
MTSGPPGLGVSTVNFLFQPSSPHLPDTSIQPALTTIAAFAAFKIEIVLGSNKNT